MTEEELSRWRTQPEVELQKLREKAEEYDQLLAHHERLKRVYTMVFAERDRLIKENIELSLKLGESIAHEDLETLVKAGG